MILSLFLSHSISPCFVRQISASSSAEKAFASVAVSLPRPPPVGIWPESAYGQVL